MTDAYTPWIGRSVTRHDSVTPRLAAEFRAAMAPFLFDPPQAEHCPPGLHWGLAPATPRTGDCGPDGAEAKGQFMPPIPLPRRMWAGGSIETLQPFRIGQQIKRVSTIASVKPRDGKTGLLVLLSAVHEFSADGELLLRERQDLVFRGSTPLLTKPQDTPDAVAAGDWTVEASPLLLFRFSAFTFNGHRIHYDAPYAMEEGYPGLVVHGPLQAALMLNLAATRLGAVPRHFGYRCVAPLFGGKTFGVSFDAASTSTRIIRDDGVTTAEGQVPAPGT